VDLHPGASPTRRAPQILRNLPVPGARNSKRRSRRPRGARHRRPGRPWLHSGPLDDYALSTKPDPTPPSHRHLPSSGRRDQIRNGAVAAREGLTDLCRAALRAVARRAKVRRAPAGAPAVPEGELVPLAPRSRAPRRATRARSVGLTSIRQLTEY